MSQNDTFTIILFSNPNCNCANRSRASSALPCHKNHFAFSWIFLPLLEELGLIDSIKNCGFPCSKTISAVQYILSFLALKLMGGARWSHDTWWNFDRALGFFAGLNVLPKSTALSTYSYRVSRQ